MLHRTQNYPVALVAAVVVAAAVQAPRVWAGAHNLPFPKHTWVAMRIALFVPTAGRPFAAGMERTHIVERLPERLRSHSWGSTVERQTGWQVPRLLQTAVAETVAQVRMQLAAELVGGYYKT